MSDRLTLQTPDSAGRGCAASHAVCSCSVEDAAPEIVATPNIANRVRLTRMRVGDTGRVCEGQLDHEDRDMLRALGLRPDARIRLSRVGEPCIVQVLGQHGCSCRIGLARPLAERVIVTIDPAHAGR